MIYNRNNSNEANNINFNKPSVFQQWCKLLMNLYCACYMSFMSQGQSISRIFTTTTCLYSVRAGEKAQNILFWTKKFF